MRWRNENGVLKPILFSAEDPFELSCCHWLLQSLKFGGEELYGDLFVFHNLYIWWRHGRCSLPAWTRFHPHQRPSDPSHQRGNMWYSSCTFKCSFSAQPYSGSLELGPPSKFLLSPSSLRSLPEAIMTVAFRSMSSPSVMNLLSRQVFSITLMVFRTSSASEITASMVAVNIVLGGKVNVHQGTIGIHPCLFQGRWSGYWLSAVRPISFLVFSQVVAISSHFELW